MDTEAKKDDGGLASPLLGKVRAYRHAVRDAMLFSRYEECSCLRAERFSQEYLPVFVGEFEWMVTRVSYAYKGCPHTIPAGSSHERMLEYALGKTRYQHLMRQVFRERRDVSEAVIIAFKHLGFEQPLRRWDRSLVDEEEVARFVARHWHNLSLDGKLAGLQRKHFYDSVVQEYGMRMSVSTARRYMLQADERSFVERQGDGLRIIA